MDDIISTIKPEQDEESPEYIDKTLKSYYDNGIPEEHIPRRLLESKERKFYSMLKGPIKKTVMRMKRYRAPDLASERQENKEWLEIEWRWDGLDWQGNKLPPVLEHIEGVWYRQDMENQPSKDNPRIRVLARVGQTRIQDLPFSKANVDKALDESMGSARENAQFIVIDGMHSGYFTYEQFTTLTWAQASQVLKSNEPQLTFGRK